MDCVAKDPPRTRKRKSKRAPYDPANAALLALPAPVLLVRRGGDVSLCNAAAATLLGVERDEVEGRAIGDLLAPLAVLEAATAGGARTELPCSLPDGACRRVGVRMGRYSQRSTRTDRLLVLDDVPHRVEPREPKPEPLPFDIVELLQLAALSHRSMTVDVTVDDGHYGRVVVVDGAPWWARDLQGDGKDALLRLLFRRCADTTCSPVDDVLPPRNLDGGLDQLLLEAARARDEERRGRAGDDLELIDESDVFELAV